MNLPSHADCLTLLERYRTPHHVVQHCFTVNKVGMTLGKALAKAGKTIDLDIVDRATILHDIVRVVNFKDFDPVRFTQTITDLDRAMWTEQQNLYWDLHHAAAAKELLTGLGYPELGEIIESHRSDAIRGETAKLDTIEKQVLYYADKRVAHTEVVSVEERFAEWGRRHEWGPEKQAEVEENKQLVLELEQQLFEGLKLRPNKLAV